MCVYVCVWLAATISKRDLGRCSAATTYFSISKVVIYKEFKKKPNISQLDFCKISIYFSVCTIFNFIAKAVRAEMAAFFGKSRGKGRSNCVYLFIASMIYSSTRTKVRFVCNSSGPFRRLSTKCDWVK